MEKKHRSYSGLLWDFELPPGTPVDLDLDELGKLTIFEKEDEFERHFDSLPPALKPFPEFDEPKHILLREERRRNKENLIARYSPRTDEDRSQEENLLLESRIALDHFHHVAEPTPLDPTVEKLALLLNIAKSVDQPSFALSFEEIEEILLSFGLLLSQSQEKLGENEDVFEHPAGIADCLGNTLMVHRSMKRPDTEILEAIGTDLLELVQRSHDRHNKDCKSSQDLETILYTLDPFDDTRSEDILSAKKYIRKLRDDLNKLDRRNWFLSISCAKAEEKRDRTKWRLQAQIDLLEERLKAASIIQAYGSTPSEERERRPLVNCTDEEDGDRPNQSRNLAKRKLSNSQLDNLRWE